MSELMNTQGNQRDFRDGLLVSVSAFALMAVICTATGAMASDDADRPTVWIELGGQLEQTSGGQDPFAPPFTMISPTPGPYRPLSPLKVQKPSQYTYGGEGKISFQPEETGWFFSASVRYGRSNNKMHIHQQSAATSRFLNPLYPAHSTKQYITETGPQFLDAKVSNEASHAVIDFQAGKDVGLGMFGHGTSVISAGVRFAQFDTKAHINMIARPQLEFYPISFAGKYFPGGGQRHKDYWATADNARNFRGIGPSLSWDASAPLVRDQDSEIALDWGINAAVLFGRQKASGAHNETARLYRAKYYATLPPYGVVTLYQHGAPHNRARTVTVPNLGGFAGVSFRYAAAKVSFGYRGDFFFGAMDGGIDAVKKENRGFFGPFATISVGMGG